ncbi:uncharacterized protein FFC1_01907 [Fusarium fujikuroi]|nr:uncharacterized protein FFC1_01907 [Fusarium fujikuroi]
MQLLTSLTGHYIKSFISLTLQQD